MAAAIVQQGGANWSPGYSYGTSQAVTLGSNITVGNCLVAVATNTGRVDIPTMVDSLGNTYIKIISGTNGTYGCSASIWVAVIISGGSSTTTATWGGSNNSHLAVYEVSGISGTADQTDSSTADTGSGNALVTTANGEFCLGVAVNTGSYSSYDMTPTGAWAWDFPGSAGQQAASSVESQIQAAAGTIQATFSGTFAGVILTATFLPAAPAGAMSAYIGGQATVSGNLTGLSGMAAHITGQATVGGTLTGSGSLAAHITGQATVSGTMKAFGALIAHITGHATVQGIIAGIGSLAAHITGQATVGGNITVPFVPDANQTIMLRIIWECHHRGIHVTVETLISTVSLWAVGHGFSYQWIEANDIATVTNDWLALQAANAISIPPLYPPNVVIISDIDVP